MDANGGEARITRMRRRYQDEPVRLSVERARAFTARWRELEAAGTALPQRVALAMKRHFETMTHHVDPDERIVGSWTEFFCGVPLDVERGLFNGVLAVELTRPAMLAYQARSQARFLRYVVRRHGVRGSIDVARRTRRQGPPPVNVGLTTMDRRKINAFAIAPHDRDELLREILPYWKGRSMADRVEAALAEAGFLSGELGEFFRSVPNTPSKQAIVVSIAAAIATYQGHLVLDYETPLRKGIAAMKREVDERLAQAPAENVAARDFLESASIALDSIRIYQERLAEAIEAAAATEADAGRKDELGRMAEICRRVPLAPAETFREAVQAFWTVHTAVELANITNVHAPGRLDQLLSPYYERDLARGAIAREAAVELCEELLLKVMTHNVRPESNFLGNFYLRYEGSTPVTLGGVRPDGADAACEMTRILLDAAERSKTITSVVLRVHPGTPDDLYHRIAAGLVGGTANLSMMNDAVFVPAMQRYGFAEADARDYAITGCTDATAPGKTGGIPFSGLLLSRVLDLTLRNGDSQTLLGPLAGVGQRTGDPRGFASFEALLDAFERQADYMISRNVEASNVRDRVFAEHLPAPFISPFVRGCLERQTDVTRGGAVYDLAGINMINSVANVVDSLFVIKKLVYEQRALTFDRLLAALDEDFHGYEDVLALIDGVHGKWGNGEAESDALAREVTDRLFRAAGKHRSYRGGPFAPYINSMTSHTIEGRVSAATPDGRRAAKPYASSCNPYNVERGGLTAVLRSVAAIDFTGLLGCAVNVRLHPSAIGQTEATRAKWAALMKTYFAMGGAQIQPTVASVEMLREAQRAPERHRDLIVKVGGYSTYFVDLGREIQDEVIARTQHGQQD